MIVSDPSLFAYVKHIYIYKMTHYKTAQREWKSRHCSTPLKHIFEEQWRHQVHHPDLWNEQNNDDNYLLLLHQ